MNAEMPCGGTNSNVCVAEGCYGFACVTNTPEGIKADAAMAFLSRLENVFSEDDMMLDRIAAMKRRTQGEINAATIIRRLGRKPHRNPDTRAVMLRVAHGLDGKHPPT